MKKFLSVILIVLCGIITPSCNKSDDDAKKPVMVILKDQISYWESVKKGIDQACSDHGTTCEISWSSYDVDSDSQMAAITKYKSNISSYSGLVIAPCNKTVCDFLAESLNTESAPLIIVDSPVPDGSSLKYHYYIGTENYQAGLQLAQEALTDIPDLLTERTYIFTFEGSTSLTARANGIKSLLTNATIVNLSENEDDAIKSIVSLSPNIDVAFGANQSNTYYLAKAMHECDLPVIPFPVYGFDDNDYILARIEDGTITGTMIQKSEEMGYQSVNYIFEASGAKNNRSIDLSAEYVTKD